CTMTLRWWPRWTPCSTTSAHPGNKSVLKLPAPRPARHRLHRDNNMLKPEECVIQHYTLVLEHGEQMLKDATAGDWEALIVRESEYISEIEKLADLEPTVCLDAAGRQAKLDLLAQIRDNEQELRELLQARMSELSELMAQSQNQ